MSALQEQDVQVGGVPENSTRGNSNGVQDSVTKDEIGRFASSSSIDSLVTLSTASGNLSAVSSRGWGGMSSSSFSQPDSFRSGSSSSGSGFFDIPGIPNPGGFDLATLARASTVYNPSSRYGDMEQLTWVPQSTSSQHLHRDPQRFSPALESALAMPSPRGTHSVSSVSFPTPSMPAVVPKLSPHLLGPDSARNNSESTQDYSPHSSQSSSPGHETPTSLARSSSASDVIALPGSFGAWYGVRNVPVMKFLSLSGKQHKSADWEGWQAPSNVPGISRSGTHAFAVCAPEAYSELSNAASLEIWGDYCDHLNFYLDRLWHRSVDLSPFSNTIMGFYDALPVVRDRSRYVMQSVANEAIAQLQRQQPPLSANSAQYEPPETHPHYKRRSNVRTPPTEFEELPPLPTEEKRLYPFPRVIVFHTGLVSRNGKSPLYGILTLRASSEVVMRAFLENPDHPKIPGLDADQPLWVWEKACTADVITNIRFMESRNLAYIHKSELPRRPRFWNYDPMELHFDPRIPIDHIFDQNHIFGEANSERRKRLPDKYRNRPLPELGSRLRERLIHLKMLLEDAPRLAVPQFFWDKNSKRGGPFAGEVTLLMPLMLDYHDNQAAECCLVLKKCSSTPYDPLQVYSAMQPQPLYTYRVVTILSFQMAFPSARVIQPVDAHWLLHGFWQDVVDAGKELVAPPQLRELPSLNWTWGQNKLRNKSGKSSSRHRARSINHDNRATSPTPAFGDELGGRSHSQPQDIGTSSSATTTAASSHTPNHSKIGKRNTQTPSIPESPTMSRSETSSNISSPSSTSDSVASMRSQSQPHTASPTLQSKPSKKNMHSQNNTSSNASNSSRNQSHRHRPPTSPRAGNN